MDISDLYYSFDKRQEELKSSHFKLTGLELGDEPSENIDDRLAVLISKENDSREDGVNEPTATSRKRAASDLKVENDESKKRIDGSTTKWLIIVSVILIMGALGALIELRKP